MTCKFDDCQYPDHACQQDPGCLFTKNRADPRFGVGLNSSFFSLRAVGTFVLMLAVAALLAYGLVTQAMAAELPKSIGRVSDYTNVLTKGQIEHIAKIAKTAESKNGVQIALVIVAKAEPSIEEFTADLFKSWGVGSKGHDTGLMILIDRSNHRVRFETGSGLEGIIPDSKAVPIIDKMLPKLRAEDYYGASVEGVTATVLLVADVEKVKGENSSGFFLLLLFGGLGVFFLLIWWVRRGSDSDFDSSPEYGTVAAAAASRNAGATTMAATAAAAASTRRRRERDEERDRERSRSRDDSSSRVSDIALGAVIGSLLGSSSHGSSGGGESSSNPVSWGGGESSGGGYSSGGGDSSSSDSGGGGDGGGGGGGGGD